MSYGPDMQINLMNMHMLSNTHMDLFQRIQHSEMYLAYFKP